MKKMRSTPYHFKTIGKVKRMNQTIISMLRTLPHLHKNKRKHLVKKLVFPCNCTKYYTSGYSPKSATLLKLTLLHGCFSHFLNCTNGTQIAQRTTYSIKLGRRFKLTIGIILTTDEITCRHKKVSSQLEGANESSI